MFQVYVEFEPYYGPYLRLVWRARPLAVSKGSSYANRWLYCCWVGFRARPAEIYRYFVRNQTGRSDVCVMFNYARKIIACETLFLSHKLYLYLSFTSLLLYLSTSPPLCRTGTHLRHYRPPLTPLSGGRSSPQWASAAKLKMDRSVGRMRFSSLHIVN